jgi:hypothetical protein
MREWAKNFSADPRERHDIEAQFELRGIVPPIELVPDAMSSLREFMRKVDDEMKNLDPETRERLDKKYVNYSRG